MTAIAAARPGLFRRATARAGSVDRFTLVLGAPLVVLLVAYVVSPMIRTAAVSTQGDGIAVNYGAFGSGRSLLALTNSLIISVATVIGCGLLALALAILVSRFRFRGRRALEVFALLPLAMPPLVGAIAFADAFGPVGMLPRLIEALTGLPARSVSFSGVSGVLLMHVMTIYPFFYLSLRAALLGADRSVEEAARSLGAGTGRIWRTVVLPLLTPALVSGALITFMISMGSLTAPLMFNVTTLTTQLLDNRTNGAEERVAAQAVLLALICLLFLLLVRRYQSRHAFVSRGKGTPATRRPLAGAGQRLGLIATSSVLAFFLSVPLLTILLTSFNQRGTWTVQVIPPVNTLDNYVSVFTDPAVFGPILTSLRLTTMATLVAVVLGIAAALVVTRWRGAASSAVDLTIMLPWALPGSVVALNLIYAFIVPGPATLGLQLVGTEVIIVIAYAILFLPLVFRSTKSALDGLDPSLDEAARSLGSSSLRSLRTVIVPMIAPAIIAGTLFAFVAGLGEFAASVLLYTPRVIPMSVQMSLFINQGKYGEAAAYGIVKILLTVVLLILAQRLERAGNGRASATIAL